MTSPAHSSIGQLFDKLLELGQQKTADQLDGLLSNVFGLLVLFLSDELSPQQRQIWLTLALEYPKPCSGAELARKIGASQVSKAIYKSLDELRGRNLVSIHQMGRVKAIQANEGHPLTATLIDLSKYYGS